MGNLCADDMYKQVKEKYPQQFQQFVAMNEIQKQVEAKGKELQSKVTAGAEDIKKENLNVIDSKHSELKNHFLQLTQDIDHSYPGGIGFLENSKQAKLDDLLGFTAVNKQFSDIKEHLNGQFTKEKQKVDQEVKELKEGEIKAVKEKTPNLQLFNQMTESAKQNIYSSGLSEYKSQIEAKAKEYLGGIDQKFSAESFTDRFKNLLPLDRLQSLTQISKEEMSKKAASFIGHPGEGKATLY